jgi:uncharacterized protein
MRCPLCKKPVTDNTNPDWPFCSERCRLLDLDNWLSGRYCVSTPAETAEKVSNTGESGQRLKGNRG